MLLAATLLTTTSALAAAALPMVAPAGPQSAEAQSAERQSAESQSSDTQVAGAEAAVAGAEAAVAGAEVAGAGAAVASAAPIERDSAETAQFVQQSVKLFFDGSATNEARLGAIPSGKTAALAWIARYSAPADAADIECFHAVERLVDVTTEYAGPWFHIDLVNHLQTEWFALVERERRRGSSIGSELYARQLYTRFEFLGRYVGARPAIEFLTEDRVAQLPTTDSGRVAQILTMRADLYRVQGRFREALEDLTRAGAHESLPLMVDVHLHEVAMKLELNLGRVDRASQQLAELRELSGRRASPNIGLARCDALAISMALTLGDERGAARQCDAFRKRWDGKLGAGADAIEMHERVEFTSQKIAIARSRDLAPEAVDRAAIESALDSIQHLMRPGSTLDDFSKVRAVVAQVEGLQVLGRLDEAVAKLQTVRAAVSDAERTTTTSRLLQAQIELASTRLVQERGTQDEVIAAAESLKLALHDLIHGWEEAPLLPGGVGFLQFEARRRALAEYVDVAVRRLPLGTEKAMDCILVADACSSVGKQLGAPRALTRDLVRYCEMQNACIVYVLPGVDALDRMVIDAGGVEHRRLSTENVSRKLRRLRRVLDTRPVEMAAAGGASSSRASSRGAWPPPALKDELHWFAELLFPESIRAKSVPYDHVVIIGVDTLGNVPVEVLPDDAGAPIGLQFPIVRAPSASALLTLTSAAMRSDEAAPRRTGKKVSLFALTGLDHDLASIDLRKGEYEAFARAAGSFPEFVSRTDATAAGFLRALRSASDLFVAWTHGAYTPQELQPAALWVAASPASSAVQSSGSLELLRAPAIEAGLRGDAAAGQAPGSAPRVVFLASCGTARGHRRAGDAAANHLGGTFLGAGAGAAIVSPVPLDRDATMSFLLAFATSYLREGASVAEAALAARRAVANDARFQHPHFWNGFQLVGAGALRKRGVARQR